MRRLVNNSKTVLEKNIVCYFKICGVKDLRRGKRQCRGRSLLVHFVQRGRVSYESVESKIPALHVLIYYLTVVDKPAM